MTDYDQMAEDFLRKTRTVICKEFIGVKTHFEDDKEKRNVWKITIKRRCATFEGKERSWSFDFGDSIYSTNNDIVRMSQKYSSGFEHLQIDKIIQYQGVRETLCESGRSFSFVVNGNKVLFLKRNDARHAPPSDYSILACISSDSYFEYDDEYEFCNEMGYEIHSWNDYKKVRDIYQACKEQARSCQSMFGDVMEQLQEIQ